MVEDNTVFAQVKASEDKFPRAYIRNMIGKGLGLPLWNPQRPLVLPPEEIVPGDVGTVDTKEGFRKLFNLWEHEHAIRGFLQRPDFKVPFRQLAERDNNRFAEGCALNCGAESSISRIPGGL